MELRELTTREVSEADSRSAHLRIDKIVAGSIECTSTSDGITCWNFVYGGEFSISRQAYHLT